MHCFLNCTGFFLSLLVLTPRVYAEQPNFVFILADDLGYKDLGCYGATDILTPSIDRLAKQGVRFTQFYANGPECTPTRTAILTGRYQQRVGGLECAIGTGGVGRYDDAIRLAAVRQLGLPATDATLFPLLKMHGYATAIVGKWHLGYDDKFAPKAQGFDHALYCLGGGMDYFHHVEEGPQGPMVVRLNGQPLQREGYFTDIIADESVSWLEANSNKPFCLYVPFTAPHSPFQGPNDYDTKPLPPDSERWQQSKADPKVYAAMIEQMDRAVGRILDQLESLGVANNTLVIFTSDNGGTKSARPSGLRGIKGTTFEGGIRVPCIVRWPSVLKQGWYTRPAMSFDLTASMLRAAGLDISGLDGVDVLDEIARNLPSTDRDLFWRQRRGDRTWRAVREESIKLVVEQQGTEEEEFLFDLTNDSAEVKNLIEERPEDALRLRAKLQA